MKKRILFVLPSLSIGGTTVSTRNVISLLSKEGYDCWVMPLRPKGVLFHLYDGVNRVETPFVIQALAAPGWTDMSSLPQKIMAMLLRFIRNHSNHFECLIVGKALTKIVLKHHFDTIVAEQESITTRFVSYVNNNNKVAWIRCDYKRYFEEGNRRRESLYNNFKAIVCVADQTCIHFKSIYPEFASKTYCISNPQDSDLIRSRANEYEDEPRFVKEGKTLVSIGRLDEVKRFDQIAPIARQLVDNGLQFRWYLIGDGAERQHIAESILKHDVEDCVVMLGAKTNPYYYINRADVLVCLSRSEACPRVVNEAKILHIPTISTDFPTIYEFIENNVTGIISSLEDIPSAIMRLFSDDKLYHQIKSNISQFEFDNKELLEQIVRII